MSKLLVAIDMQKGFESEDSKAIKDQFNKSFSFFDNVCFTMFENKKNSLFETKLNWIDLQNDTEKELMDDLDVPETSEFVWHSTYTVYNDELKALIAKVKPTEIFLAGLFTDMCLMKTAIDMFDDNITPYIIKDLSVSSHGEIAHNVVFETLKMAIGDDRIINIGDIL